MRTRHTQGQWKVKGESYGNYISVGTDKQQVCRVNWGKEDTEYDFANAKLIASAPELLEVLKQAVLRLEEYPTFSRQYSEDEKTFLIAAKKVIKKATE